MFGPYRSCHNGAIQDKSSEMCFASVTNCFQLVM